MRFLKMQGAGNSYIYTNAIGRQIADPAALARRISDKNFGIGADGLILILPSASADFRMEMYNADGSRAQMCGNGIRCFAKFVYDTGLTKKTALCVQTDAGKKQVMLLLENGEVTGAVVDMGAPVFTASRIPAAFATPEVINEPLTVGVAEFGVTCVSMGNPHCVLFMGEIESLNLAAIGPQFEWHPAFAQRINTEFVVVQSETQLQMRVWERGAGETLACGTGACASVAAAVKNGYCRQDSDITVHLRGGDLLVRWDSAADTIYMTGPVKTICTGDYLDE